MTSGGINSVCISNPIPSEPHHKHPTSRHSANEATRRTFTWRARNRLAGDTQRADCLSFQAGILRRITFLLSYTPTEYSALRMLQLKINFDVGGLQLRVLGLIDNK